MKHLRLLIIVLGVVLLAACSNSGNEPQEGDANTIGNVGDFTAVNEAGEDFNVADLEGHWWIADFIFTNCTTTCLPMTANMGKLQDMLEDEGLDDVKLVSFSVDPDRDTPEVLLEYAEENGADLDRWTFLTGYDFETIEEYSIETFKSIVAPPPEGDDQVSHGTSFFLIDPEGNIQNFYKGINMEEVEQIVADLKNVN